MHRYLISVFFSCISVFSFSNSSSVKFRKVLYLSSFRLLESRLPDRASSFYAEMARPPFLRFSKKCTPHHPTPPRQPHSSAAPTSRSPHFRNPPNQLQAPSPSPTITSAHFHYPPPRPSANKRAARNPLAPKPRHNNNARSLFRAAPSEGRMTGRSPAGHQAAIFRRAGDPSRSDFISGPC